jgi:hypothetical protein
MCFGCQFSIDFCDPAQPFKLHQAWCENITFCLSGPLALVSVLLEFNVFRETVLGHHFFPTLRWLCAKVIDFGTSFKSTGHQNDTPNRSSAA